MTTEASSAHRALRAAEARLAANAATLASPRRASAARSNVLGWVGLSAAIVAGALLFWSFDALPFMDLPAHAGLIAMRHRWGASPLEQQYFVYAPHLGPYSLFRGLGELFDRALGPLGAVRALATLPVVATPLALVFARRRLHGEVTPGFGYVGVLLSFGLMTLFGFASYLLGEACLVVTLTLWLELLAAADGAPRSTGRLLRLEVAVALAAPLLFVAHGHAFVLFLVLAVVTCVAAGDRPRRLVRLRALVPAVALAAGAAWEEGSSAPTGAVAVSAGKMAPFFEGALDKLSLLATPTLMTKSGVDLAAGLAVWAGLLLGLAATARASLASPQADPRACHTRALLACVVTLTVLFLALPHAVGWFGFVDGRLVPLVMLIGLMALRLDAVSPWLRFGFDRLAIVLAAAVLVVNYVASYRFQDEARGWHEVLQAIPAGSRILNLPLDPNSEVFTGHPFVHYDKLVLVDRPAVVSDVWFHQGTALYPRPGNPALRLPADYLSSDLHVTDLSAYHLEDWDYVLVRTRPEAASLPLPVPASLCLADHRGGWWLFKETRSQVCPVSRLP
jgi:hypothetical protein